MWQIMSLSFTQYSLLQDSVFTELEKANSKLSDLKNEALKEGKSFPPAVQEVKGRIKMLEELKYKLAHPVGETA